MNSQKKRFLKVAINGVISGGKDKFLDDVKQINDRLEKISPETFGKTLKELQEDIDMENEAKKQ